MKKVLLIMAAALMTMTQCRKQETSPATPSANTIKMTITAGPGAKTDINTATGAITWTSGDVLYVSDGTNWLGSLDLDSGAGDASGTFTGTIQGIGEGTTTCHFFYLGKGNIATTPTGTAAANISLASQDGTLRGENGAMKYHMGYGIADVTVSEGSATAPPVAMKTEIAIAHLKLKMDGEDYTGSVTMDVSNTMTVSPAGTFTGSDDKGIAIGNNGGTPGDRYVTLIPTEATSVSFSGSATGSMTFGHGIQANNLYGMANGIEVTLTKPLPYLPGDFTVSSGKTVKFSKGNLYWDGSSWKFEANQWDFRTYEGKNSCINGSVTTNGTPTGHWGLFGWSTGSTTYGMSISMSNSDYSGNFKDWGGNVIGDDAADTWRTLTDNEWKYLLNTNGSSGRTDANRFAKAKVNGVCGLLIFPDGYNGGEAIGSITGVAALNTTNAAYPTESISDATWTSMESAGVVFLPAAGYRYGTYVYNVGSNGYYRSVTPSGLNSAYSMYFDSGNVSTRSNYRYLGYSVRLVRSAS